MLWRGKSGRMADGERVMSTARAALSVSLRALFSASLCPRCYVMLSSFRAHVHSAARIGRLCPRSDRGSVVRLCRKGSNNKEKPSCGKLHPLESKPSHVTAPAGQFSQEEANALRQRVSKSRRCAAGKSSVFELAALPRLHIQPPDRRGYASIRWRDVASAR